MDGTIDMGIIQNVFQKAADSIVQASELSKTVQELETKVKALAEDVEKLREVNRHLDEQLAYVRQERDELRTKLWQTEGDRDQYKRDHEQEKRHHESTQAALTGVMENLHKTSAERDEAQLKVMELEEKLALAESKIRDIAKVLEVPKLEEVASPKWEDMKEITQGSVTPFHTAEDHSPTEEEQPRDPETGQFKPWAASGF